MRMKGNEKEKEKKIKQRGKKKKKAVSGGRMWSVDGSRPKFPLLLIFPTLVCICPVPVVSSFLPASRPLSYMYTNQQRTVDECRPPFANSSYTCIYASHS